MTVFDTALVVFTVLSSYLPALVWWAWIRLQLVGARVPRSESDQRVGHRHDGDAR